MAPAMVIRAIADAQAKAFAQDSDTSLEEWYQNGPYRNSVFIFNLLMPGDWSSLPFPLSRALRDAARGQMDLRGITQNYIGQIGVWRDLRLVGGALGEAGQTVTGEINAGPIHRKYEEPGSTGWSIFGEDSFFGGVPPEDPRVDYAWR
jgi:hypothetical protein